MERGLSLALILCLHRCAIEIRWLCVFKGSSFSRCDVYSHLWIYHKHESEQTHHSPQVLFLGLCSLLPSTLPLSAYPKKPLLCFLLLCDRLVYIFWNFIKMKVYNITEDIHKIYAYLQQSIHEFVLYIWVCFIYFMVGHWLLNIIILIIIHAICTDCIFIFE